MSVSRGLAPDFVHLDVDLTTQDALNSDRLNCTPF